MSGGLLFLYSKRSIKGVIVAILCNRQRINQNKKIKQFEVPGDRRDVEEFVTLKRRGLLKLNTKNF